MLTSRLKIVIISLLIAVIVFCCIYFFILLNDYCIKKTNDYGIAIEDSYNIWSPKRMKMLINAELVNKYGTLDAFDLSPRDYHSMYLEWWLHNIGYHVTKPFCFINKIYEINFRCKDVNLEIENPI